MASGLNGQKFAFHGYLPIEVKDAIHSIKELENESRSKNQTQIFIETPYRNNQLANSLFKGLHLKPYCVWRLMLPVRRNYRYPYDRKNGERNVLNCLNCLLFFLFLTQ